MTNKIIIGSRGSKLSLAYANKVKSLISNIDKTTGKKIVIETIKTSGDQFQDKKISEIGGKNLFCKEIEDKLIKKEIDIAVHSLKDMDSIETKGLIIQAYIKRNDPRESFVSKKFENLLKLNNAKIGSSSRRRELQLKRINKKISVVNLRGNIDTRIQKVEEKKLDAIILAAAGIKSLKLENKISFIFETNEILPAVGQGIIAVQCRKDDKLIIDIIKKINDRETSLCAKAERKMLQTIGGDCETAVGGLAEIYNNNLKLKAQLFSDLGDESFEYELTGRDVDASHVGKAVGEKLLSLAGKKFKKK